MKGKLVRLLPDDYPQYKGKVGVVVSERMVDRFVINFDGGKNSIHHPDRLEVIREGR